MGSIQSAQQQWSHGASVLPETQGFEIIPRTRHRVDAIDEHDPAALLPHRQDIGENPLGHAIEGGKFNEPYQY